MPNFGSDLDLLREVSHVVRQPAFEDLVDTRRRRTRRVWIAAATLSIAAIATVGGVATNSQNPRTDAPPTLSDPGDVRTMPRHLVERNGTPLKPGTYQMTVAKDAGVEAPEVLVTVPNGYVESSDWYVVSDDGTEFLAVYAVGKVMHDACHETKNNMFRPGPSIQDLADALTVQTSSRTTTPVPVSLAGHQGVYLEMTGPRDINKCVKYPAGPWGGRGIYGDNQVDRLWILDVNGQRLVVDASHSEDSPAADNDTLTTIANSLEFVPTS